MTPDDLRALVAVMRELGVVQADGIVLGPVPPQPARGEELPETPAERRARLVAVERERIELLVGHPITQREFDAMHDPEAIA